MKRSNLRGLGIWFVVLSQVGLVTGCRQQGGREGRQGGVLAPGSTVAPGATAGVNLGQMMFDMLRQNLVATGTADQVKALDGNKSAFIDAINRTLPSDVTKGLFPMLMKMMPLVDNDTIPKGMQDVSGMLKDLLASPATIQALVDVMSAKGGSAIDAQDMVRLISRLLSHPQFDDLARATNELIRTNPDLLKNVLTIVARKLQGVTANTFSGSLNLQGLSGALLTEVDTAGLGDLGAPAWSVRLDLNGNPKVTIDPATLKVCAPFVDDGMGNALVDPVSKKPVDAAGKEITLRPFGKDGTRDNDGRAITAGGLTVFEYFDAKKTLLGETLVFVGKMMAADVPGDLVTVLDKTVTRVTHVDPTETWQGFGPDNCLIDLTYAQLELVRRTPAPQLLEGLALVVKANPAGFEQLVTDLVIAMNLAMQSGFSTAAQGNMIQDLLPLVSDACKAQGQNISAVRALLRSFNSAQAQLQNLPQGFAKMMKFNDFGKQVATGPGLPSAMERLLGIMERSNQCNAPFLGNLAELYLDTMAGNNKPILGIKLDIHTMNSLMKISFLRQLLCSQLNADDCNVLQDFADTGTLDAFVPIAKAFSDQGETKLLVQIMLALGKTYATAMRPNEGAVVKLLESGAVNKLFGAINNMTKVTLPSNGANLIDVLADTVAALVDDSQTITDRKGRSHKTLVSLLLAPMADFKAAAQTAGVQANLDRVMGTLMQTLLATYTDANGKEKLVYSGFVATLGQTLAFVSKTIPADAAQRSQWVDAAQQGAADAFQSRDVAALVDLFLTVRGSAQAKIITDALVGLFTPMPSAKYDALGAILQLAAGVLQAPPSSPLSAQSAANLAMVLNWVGTELDPKNGKMTNLLIMVQEFVKADDGLLILKIVRNLVDVGTNGTDTAPILVLMKVLGDIQKAAGAQGMTAAGMTAMLNKMVNFMDDKKTGMAHIWEIIKNRPK